jgi:hypothetical protein
MVPRDQRLKRDGLPHVVAGDAERLTGSIARINASARAGANPLSLKERHRGDPAPSPHCRDSWCAARLQTDTVVRTFAPWFAISYRL